jgi:hypothetical protein
MWPPLSLYFTITRRCWPRAKRPQTHKESARKSRRRRREWAPNWLVGGGGDGGGLIERGHKKPTYGDTVKSSLIQDTSYFLPSLVPYC